MYLHGVKTLTHNLIHIFCAELPWVWKTAVLPRFQALKTVVFSCCLNFNQWHKSDINQSTWLLILRLHTILSTDCVQNLSGLYCPLRLDAATFLRSINFSFGINGLMLIAGFAHNLVHSKCAEL